MAAVIKLRRDTASDWLTKNPVLREGEPGFEVDTGRLKIGDGQTAWMDLLYFTPLLSGGASDEAVLAHIESALPHPVYDDGPSLVLLYENAKV